jgi:light-regulated signal transduction histidine kinase (bacteriophytochrome)
MASRSELPLGVDLSACDSEPIHMPGSVQPHGRLLIVDQASQRVVAGAGDLEDLFGADWLGADIAALLWPGGIQPDPGIAAGPGGAVPAGIFEAGSRRFDITLHRTGDTMIVELEEAGTDPIAGGAMLAWLDAVATTFERTSDLAALCDRAATAFRALTGFDRVMIYRFLDDDAGRVIAEDSDPTIGSFLHHHFPATDIPRQARALYIRNRARAIPDVAYAPQPIRPASYQDTDLSDVAIRSVSPIHIRYLENMEVGASASMSIVKDGVLWGLIACHHNTPKLMPRDVRLVATTLASVLARQIRAKEEALSYRERLRLRTAGDGLLPRMTEMTDTREGVRHFHDELRTMMTSDGLVYARGTAIDCYGHCPDHDDLRDLVGWLRSRRIVEPFVTEALGDHYPDAAAVVPVASGMLALPLLEEGAMLVWLRAEQVEEVEWAGNPHGATGGSGDAPLTPRASFDSWVETVRGRARRWTLEEVEASHRLRRAIQDSERSRRIRDLNERLQRTIEDKDALLAQKDVLMKEVDHRVQNSLQLVSAFLSMQARAAGPGDVAASLAEAQSRLSAVALVHRRLYRDDQIESVDLARYLGELVDDLRQSLGGDWASRMRVDLAPVLIPTDRAVSVGLVLTELVINATKYAYDGGAGPIEITLEQHRRRYRLIVADQGRGIAAAAKSRKSSGGFGSRMMDAVVQRIEGEIELADNHPGTRAILTAPIGDER